MGATDGMPRDWRQWRRFQALRLKQDDWYQRDIAEALGVTEVSVSHWLAHARIGGASALLSRPIPGRPAELSPTQRRMIPEFLWHGAEAYGFRGSLWTCARVARVIDEEFAVAYDKSQVSRLLNRLGWTPQTPIRRASQRDEQAIELWRRTTWPRLLHEAKTERRTLVFVDEAGFYLLPSVVKTYAPMARTPVLRARLTRDHLSVMGGMTPRGRIYTLARQESLNGSHGIAPASGFPPGPSDAGGNRAVAGHLGWLADPPPNPGWGVCVRDSRQGAAGSPARLRPRPEPVG